MPREKQRTQPFEGGKDQLLRGYFNVFRDAYEINPRFRGDLVHVETAKVDTQGDRVKREDFATSETAKALLLRVRSQQEWVTTLAAASLALELLLKKKAPAAEFLNGLTDYLTMNVLIYRIIAPEGPQSADVVKAALSNLFLGTSEYLRSNRGDIKKIFSTEKIGILESLGVTIGAAFVGENKNCNIIVPYLNEDIFKQDPEAAEKVRAGLSTALRKFIPGYDATPEAPLQTLSELSELYADIRDKGELARLNPWERSMGDQKLLYIVNEENRDRFVERVKSYTRAAMKSGDVFLIFLVRALFTPEQEYLQRYVSERDRQFIENVQYAYTRGIQEILEAREIVPEIQEPQKYRRLTGTETFLSPRDTKFTKYFKEKLGMNEQGVALIFNWTRASDDLEEVRTLVKEPYIKQMVRSFDQVKGAKARVEAVSKLIDWTLHKANALDMLRVLSQVGLRNNEYTALFLNKITVYMQNEGMWWITLLPQDENPETAITELENLMMTTYPRLLTTQKKSSEVEIALKNVNVRRFLYNLGLNYWRNENNNALIALDNHESVTALNEEDITKVKHKTYELMNTIADTKGPVAIANLPIVTINTLRSMRFSEPVHYESPTDETYGVSLNVLIRSTDPIAFAKSGLIYAIGQQSSGGYDRQRVVQGIFLTDISQATINSQSWVQLYQGIDAFQQQLAEAILLDTSDKDPTYLDNVYKFLVGLDAINLTEVVRLIIRRAHMTPRTYTQAEGSIPLENPILNIIRKNTANLPNSLTDRQRAIVFLKTFNSEMRQRLHAIQEATGSITESPEMILFFEVLQYEIDKEFKDIEPLIPRIVTVEQVSEKRTVSQSSASAAEPVSHISDLDRIRTDTIPIEELESKPVESVNLDALLSKGDHWFRDYYSRINSLSSKFLIARALLSDPQRRFNDYSFLLNNFLGHLSEDTQLTASDKRPFLLKAKLSKLAIERGFVQITEAESSSVYKSVELMIQDHPDLSELQGILPPHVLGAVATALLFDEKLSESQSENRRSIVTNAIVGPMSKYIGPHLRYKGHKEMTFSEIVNHLPDRVFENPNEVIRAIVRNFLSDLAIRMLPEGEFTETKVIDALLPFIGGSSQLSDIKQELLFEIAETLEKIKQVHIPPVFKPFVEGVFDQPSPFPLYQQRAVVYYTIENNNRMFLIGKPGSAKTGTTMLIVEAIGCNSVLVVGPRNAAGAWTGEAEKLYIDPTTPDPENKVERIPRVFVIRKGSDLKSDKTRKSQYLFLSTTYLADAEDSAEKYQQLLQLMITRNTDAIAVDESHVYTDLDAKSTRVLMKLINDVREFRKGKLALVFMTGTPSKDLNLEDYNVPMAALYPEEYSLARKPQYEGAPVRFSVRAINQPHIAYTLLHGNLNRLVYLLSSDTLFKEQVPQAEDHYKRVIVNLSDYEKVIYSYAFDLPFFDPLSKIRLLYDCLINPFSIRTSIIEALQNNDKELPIKYTETEILQRIQELYQQWSTWDIQSKGSERHGLFGAEWIAQVDPALILQLHFDKNYSNGIDSLIAALQEVDATGYKVLNKALNTWTPREHISTKLAWVQQKIRDCFDEEGNIKRKLFIIAPHRAEGVTIPHPDGGFSVLDFVKQSLPEYIQGDVNKIVYAIDEKIGPDRRLAIAKRSREEGDQYPIVVATLETIGLSMDWAPRDTPSMSNIEGVDIITLYWPWGFHDYMQLMYRWFRPGIGKLVHGYITEAADTLDQGGYLLAILKHWQMIMSLYAVQPDAEVRELLSSATKSQKYVLTEEHKARWQLINNMNNLKGAGEDALLHEFGRTIDAGRIDYLFGQQFYKEGRDIFTVNGNAARLTAQLAALSGARSIVSVGAGSCMFARSLAEITTEMPQILNVDINNALLSLMKDIYPQIGETLVSRATNMRAIPTNSQDFVECSYVLDWASAAERIQITTEIHRIAKQNAIISIALPESALDILTFRSFATYLEEYLGLELIQDRTGRMYSTDTRPQRLLGWIFTGVKRNPVRNEPYKEDNLRFLTDPQPVIVDPRKDKRRIVEVQAPSKVNGIDSFIATHFSIHNPLTRRETEVQQYIPRADAIETQIREVAQKIQKIEQAYDPKVDWTREQRALWNTAIKWIALRENLLDEDAEKVLIEIVTPLGVLQEQEWDQTYIVAAIAVDISQIPDSDVRDMQAQLETMSVQRNKWVQTCHYIEKELGIDFETANKFLYGLVKGSYYQDLRNINVQKFREYVEDHIYYIKQYNFPIIT